MIRISQLKLPVDHTPDALEKKICQQLKIKKEELSSWKIVRRSLDARKKPDLKFVYVVDVDTLKERKILHRMQKVNDKNIMLTNKAEYQFPAGGTEKLKQPPVVIGSGPDCFAHGQSQKQDFDRLFMSVERKHQNERKRLISTGKTVFWTRTAMCSSVKGAPVHFRMAN